MPRLPPILAAFAFLASPAFAVTVLPANLSVEVTTRRDGVISRKMLVKVRPGEQIVMRDETAPARVSGPLPAPADLVVTMIPEVSGNTLLFRMASTVNAGKPLAATVGTGQGTRQVERERTFRETVEARAVPGEWQATQDLSGTGLRVTIVAKPLHQR